MSSWCQRWDSEDGRSQGANPEVATCAGPLCLQEQVFT